MKRGYDTVIDFSVFTDTDCYTMVFSTDWKYQDMLNFMTDTYSINPDSIVEIRNTFIKSFKILKDA